MTPDILSFINDNRIGVICVTMPDGTPHAATIHYSHSEEPFVLYVSTRSNSRKCESLVPGKTAKASFVIGFDESTMKTFQADGEVTHVTDADELEKIYAIHYAKHPFAEKFKADPTTAILKFTPNWWRFSDYLATPPRITASN